MTQYQTLELDITLLSDVNVKGLVEGLLRTHFAVVDANKAQSSLSRALAHASTSLFANMKRG